MNCQRALWVCLLGITGCSGPSSLVVVEHFGGPVSGWAAIDGRQERPARDLRVARGRLELSGSRMLVRDVYLVPPFGGVVELSLEGGDPLGFAGVFIEELSDPLGARAGGQRRTAVRSRSVLGLQARGQWATWEGNPLHPARRPAWSRLDADVWPGPLAIEIEAGGDALGMSIRGQEDGAVVFPLTRPSGATHTVEYRLGIFTNLLNLAVDQVVLGESGETGGFRAEGLLEPGTAAEATALLRLAEERASRPDEAVRPGRVSGVIEPLLAAMRIQRRRGDQDAVREVALRGREALAGLGEAAARTGEGPLVARAMEALGAGEAEASGERPEGSPLAGRHLEAASEAEASEQLVAELIHLLAADSGRLDGEHSGRVRELAAAVLGPLRLDFEVLDRSGAPPPRGRVFRQWFSQPVLDLYGAIPRDKAGELVIQLAIESTDLRHQSMERERPVYLSPSRRPLAQELERERGRLWQRYEKDLMDGQVQTRILRAGKMTTYQKADLQGFSLDAPGAGDVELPVFYGRRLERTLAEIAELDRRIEEQRKLGPVQDEVPAKLMVDYVRFELSYRLELGGRVLLDGSVRDSEGFEQWVHAADEERGLEASTYDKAARDRLVRQVRERVSSRLGTGLSLPSVLAHVDVDEGTAFIIRMARATGDPEDRDVLRWRLKSVYGLSGILLDSVTSVLLSTQVTAG